jgi:diketogulonate reductase-like aldo/keto reductase
LTQNPALLELGKKRGVGTAQIALAWCLHEPDIIVIPRSVTARRIEENFRAGDLQLSALELQRLEQASPVRHRWLKANPLLRHARSAAHRQSGNTQRQLTGRRRIWVGWGSHTG